MNLGGVVGVWSNLDSLDGDQGGDPWREVTFQKESYNHSIIFVDCMNEPGRVVYGLI